MKIQRKKTTTETIELNDEEMQKVAIRFLQEKYFGGTPVPGHGWCPNWVCSDGYLCTNEVTHMGVVVEEVRKATGEEQQIQTLIDTLKG